MSELVKLKVRISIGVCRKCGAKRKAYYLSNYSYGERLMLTTDTKYYGYINLIKDEVFDEVEMIMKEFLSNANIALSLKESANCLNSIFGIACDTIQNSSINASNNQKYCTACSSKEIDFESEKHEEIEEIEFQVISHNSWKKLSSSEKKELIKLELVKNNFL